MADSYGPTSPNGAKDGDRWTNSTTGESFTYANNGWVSNKPIATSPSSPTLAAASGAGTGPPAPILFAGSNDVRGVVSFGTGSSPPLGPVVNVTFQRPYGSGSLPFVGLDPANSASSGLRMFVATQNATGFTVSVTGALIADQGATTYMFTYGVIG